MIMKPDNGPTFGLFEPDKTLYVELYDRLKALGAVALGSNSSEHSLKLVHESPLLDLSGAFVGNFDGEARVMRGLIDALRSRFPHAYLVGMVDSMKFKIGADYKISYENLFVKFDSIVARITENANIQKLPGK